MFSNGKTATEAFSDNGADGVHHRHAVKPARSKAKAEIMPAAAQYRE